MGVEEVQQFVVEKLKEALVAVENLGGEALAWFESVFPSETRSEKIKEWWISVENSGAVGLSWFAEVFPPGTRAEMITHWFHISKPYLTAAAALAVVVMCLRFCGGRGGGGGPVKMMKAPGRNTRIARAEFVSNPKGYFRQLHARK